METERACHFFTNVPGQEPIAETLGKQKNDSKESTYP